MPYISTHYIGIDSPLAPAKASSHCICKTMSKQREGKAKINITQHCPKWITFAIQCLYNVFICHHNYCVSQILFSVKIPPPHFYNLDRFTTFSPFPLVHHSSTLSSGHAIFVRASCIEACTYFILYSIFPRVPWLTDRSVCGRSLHGTPVCLKAGVVCSLLTSRPMFVLFPTAHMCAHPAGPPRASPFASCSWHSS